MTNATSSPAPAQHHDNTMAWVIAYGLMAWAMFWTLVVQWWSLGYAWYGDITTMDLSQHEALALGLVAPIVIGAPILLGLLIKAPRPRAAVRTLLWATLASLLFLLPRALFPPDAVYAAGLTRAVLGLLMGAGLLAWSAKRGRLGRCDVTALLLALLLGLLMLMPWVKFGALGNGWDVLVDGLQALALAVTMVGLAAYLLPQLTATSVRRRHNLFLGGSALLVSFLMIGGSWGQMDYQALLMGVLPALAFPLALFGTRDSKYPAGAGLALSLFAAFGTLAFFDPVELNLYSLFSGEAAKYAFAATTWTVTIGWIALFLSVIFPDALMRSRMKPIWGGLAGVAAIAGVAVYLLVGHPGFFGDDFFVVMSTQADLSRAQSISDVDERRAWVYETLVQQADVSQRDLTAWLDARGIPYTRYYLTNGIEVHASAIRRWQIARRPDVLKIVYSPELRPIPELPPMMPGNATRPDEPTWGLEAMGVPKVWEELGVTGKGVVIGQSDTGVDATHPALADGYRGAEMGTDDYNWLDAWYGKPQPYDINGHGTHTLATAAGDDLVGVAPDAEWFACANLVRSFGSPAYYLTCMQFMLAPYPQGGDAFRDGKPELAADVSTNSWGCPARIEGCDQETLWFATEALRDAGIFFVAAAGNEGPACNSLQTPPGNYANTILSVGAMDPAGDVANFSNRGPETHSPDGARGPDILAPGVEVLSAWPDGGWNSIEGTSMAAPHVAGVVALMWSANPALRGNVAATERILLETASPYHGAPTACGDGQTPDPATGYGVVNAYEAVKAALAWQP